MNPNYERKMKNGEQKTNNSNSDSININTWNRRDNILFSSFGKKQMKLLTEESNKILQSDISKDNIDFDIKTEKN